MKKSKLLKDFLYSGSLFNPNKDVSQEIRRTLRPASTAMKDQEKICKFMDVSLETKVKIIHNVVFTFME